MKSFLKIAAVVLCMTIMGSVSWAEETVSTVENKVQIKAEPSQDNPLWATDKARLKNLVSEKLTEEEDCQIRWDILWSWAKKGNLEARAMLSRLTAFPWPATPRIFMPGRSMDELSNIRDATILAVHSIGVRYSDVNQQRIYNENSNALYSEFLKYVPYGESFLSCLKEKSGEYCARFAFTPVDDSFKTKLIPTFEEYAVEIDALVAQGMKPKCIYFRDTRPWSERGNSKK